MQCNMFWYELVIWFYFSLSTIVALIDSSDNLHILRSTMVKGKEALHSKDSMLPCLGMCWTWVILPFIWSYMIIWLGKLVRFSMQIPPPSPSPSIILYMCAILTNFKWIMTLHLQNTTDSTIWWCNFHLILMTFKCHLFFRERVPAPKDETAAQSTDIERQTAPSIAKSLKSLPGSQQADGSEDLTVAAQNGSSKPNYSNRSLLKSSSISASKCVVVKPKGDSEVSDIILHK